MHPMPYDYWRGYPYYLNPYPRGDMLIYEGDPSEKKLKKILEQLKSANDKLDSIDQTLKKIENEI